MPKSSASRIIETYLRANEDRDIMLAEFAANIHDLLVNEADKKFEEYIVVNYEQLDNKYNIDDGIKASKKRKSTVTSFKPKSSIQRTFSMKKLEDDDIKKEINEALSEENDEDNLSNFPNSPKIPENELGIKNTISAHSNNIQRTEE